MIAPRRSRSANVTALIATASAFLGVPASAVTPVASVPAFSHVVVVVFENKEVGKVFGSQSAPNFNRLARRYATLGNYTAVSHPSLPNYLAMVSGSTQAVTSDCLNCQVDAPTIADSLEESGRSWKTYAEGIPSPGSTAKWSGHYAKKHNPLIYFRAVASQPDRRNRIVPLSQLAADLAGGTLPDFSLVIPDECHDMHDCSVATGDSWLRGFVKPLLASRQMANGVVFVVFDEGDSEAGGGGSIAAMALGRRVRPASASTAPINHYSLLRTIEDAWGLPRLGHSAEANPITGIWSS